MSWAIDVQGVGAVGTPSASPSPFPPLPHPVSGALCWAGSRGAAGVTDGWPRSAPLAALGTALNEGEIYFKKGKANILLTLHHSHLLLWKIRMV